MKWNLNIKLLNWQQRLFKAERLLLPEKIIVIIALLCVCSSTKLLAAEIESNVNELTTWLDVEVIADEIKNKQDIRLLTEILPGSLLSIRDPKLPEACSKVREAYPTYSVTCRSIEIENRTAYYVVELTTKHKYYSAKLACDSNIEMQSDLKMKNTELLNTITKRLQNTQVPLVNFVNKYNFLDYEDHILHDQAVGLNSILSKRYQELISALDSCDPEVRASTIQLLNFAGRPYESIDAIKKFMLDDNLSVRNNAIRFLSTFYAFVTQKDIKSLVLNSCNVMKNQYFFDQNKSLSLLFQFVESRALKKKDIPELCLDRIKYLAKESRTPQIGGYAKTILRKLSN